MPKLYLLTIFITLLIACEKTPKTKITVIVNQPYQEINFYGCGTGMENLDINTLDTLATEYAQSQTLNYTGFDTIGMAKLVRSCKCYNTTSSLDYTDTPEIVLPAENKIEPIIKMEEYRSIVVQAQKNGTANTINDCFNFVFYINNKLIVLSYTVEHERVIK